MNSCKSTFRSILDPIPIWFEILLREFNLDQPTISRFRKELYSRLEELEDSEKTTTEDHRTVELDQATQGRLSRMDAMQVQVMALETKRRQELGILKIMSALKRIEEDEFVWCVSCSDEIALKRLELDPATPTCIECASKAS